jgi:hypothetical protein
VESTKYQEWRRLPSWSIRSAEENRPKEWLRIITACASIPNLTIWPHFPSFGRFLEQLGAKPSPRSFWSYLEPLDGELAHFLPSMLCGLEQSQVER